MRAITLLCFGAIACGPPPAKISEGFYFDPNWVSEIHIELDPEDFEVLRHQERNFDDVFCAPGPPPNPYTYYEADITIDGITVHDIGVRKKGFFGSVVADRPSFKVSFNEYVRGQRFFGMRRMTLQNAVSDGSRIKQCLGYELFDAGGVPASRCAYAHVTVNDEDLGLYTHLESIKTELISRYFDNTTGNLYEGALSDFQPSWIGTFQRKTNFENPDRSDLDRVMEAAEAPDEDLVESLQHVIALDEFFDFWAMEVLIAHWDGYASFNHNNFYIYNNPETGLFHFFPWGIDGILFDIGDRTRSVFADSILPHRLYKYGPTRDIYLDRVRDKLDTVWDEGAILTRIDEMEDLITPFADPYGTGVLGQEINNVRGFVSTYPQLILDEINNGPVVWENQLTDPPCFRVAGDLLVTDLETTWSSIDSDPFAAGSAQWQTTWTPEEGSPYVEVPTQVGVLAGMNRDVPPGTPPKPTMFLLAVLPGSTHDLLNYIALEFPDTGFVAPGTLPLGFGEAVFAFLLTVDPEVEGSEVFYFLDGELTLHEAAATPGAAITGSITAEIRETGW